MFIASIGGMLFFSSFTGDVRLSDVSGVAGMSIFIGVAEADGLAFGVPVVLGIGAVVVAEEDGPIVIPGIGAIVAWGEGWAPTVCGAIEKTPTAETFIIERQSNTRRKIFSISYTL